MAASNQALEKYTEVSEAVEAAIYYAQTHKREFPHTWYDWQLDGFNEFHRQVMTLAGNQTGKTLSGGYHFACDITQDYPEGWEGFEFDHCINALAIGVDAVQLDVLQGILFGEVINKQFTGGWIHVDEIDTVIWSRTTTGLASKVIVRGKYGLNTVYLRSYSQAKTGQDTLSFAGKIFDLIWADEQPPDELIGQLNVRLLNGDRGRGGRMRFTMTPELGKTKLIQKFQEGNGKHQRLIGPVSWNECGHMTPDAQEAALEGIPEFEHELRRDGVPSFGSGMVFPIAEGRIRCDPFDVREYSWFKGIRAMDLGNNTGVGWLAYDPQMDIIYLVRVEKMVGETAANHAAAANSMWADVPMVFPHDVGKDTGVLEKGAGTTIRKLYRTNGIKHAIDFKNDDGSLFVEPGITYIFDRMKSGRFKVFSDCTEFWHEFRLYHRKDGVIVKENDHVMDLTRYGGVMVTRYGKQIGGRITKPKVKRAMAGKDRR